MNSDVVQSVLHLSSACADEARTPQLRAAGQITGVRPGMTDVLGERQRVQGARAPRWSGASALLRPLADLQLPPPSVGKRRHGVTGVLQADPARVTGSNAITWPVTRLTGTSSVTAKVTAPVILLYPPYLDQGLIQTVSTVSRPRYSRYGMYCISLYLDRGLICWPRPGIPAGGSFLE